MSEYSAWPKPVKKLKSDDVVQIIMDESVAREFERSILVRRGLKLSIPLVFSADDLPSYIITA